MTKLPETKPVIVKSKKAKVLISGRGGSGKSFFCCSLPKTYYIATESGAEREQYQKLLLKSGSAYIGEKEGSKDFDKVVAIVKLLATTKHSYQNLVIDSFSHIYLLRAAIAEAEIGSEFGRDKKEANKPTRQLLRWIDKVDMNVFLIAHLKDKWARSGTDMTYAGTTYDGYEKLEYELDLWIEAAEQADKRIFVVKKTRVESMPRGLVGKLDYESFANLYGREALEGAVTVLKLVTTSQLEEIKKINEIFNISAEQIKSTLKKCSCEATTELSESQAQTYIDFYNKKIGEK